jgi:hypothetical protein
MKNQSKPTQELAIVIDIKQRLDRKSIALVILYGLDLEEHPLNSVEDLPDILASSFPDILSVKDMVKRTYLEAGSSTANFEFIQNWYKSMYGMNKPTFDLVLKAVENYVQDLGVV